MNQERRQLKLDLHYFFVDKHKNVWFFQSVDMESLAVGLKDNSDHKNSEHFHEFLRAHTGFFLPTKFMLQRILFITISVV